MILQVFIVSFAIDTFPAVSVFLRHIPVFKRYTYGSIIYAISRAGMYIVTSFGIVYINKYLGNYGLPVLIIPILIGCFFSFKHFENLEKEVGKWF